MPWGRVDDHHYRHPKVNDLDESMRKGCIALYWLAISWCNDYLTDGRVPAGTVRILGGDVTEADELVRVGLWEKDGTAYRVHDFLDFNKSKAQVEEERIQRTLAGRAGAHVRWHSASDLPSEPASDLPNGTASEVLSEMHGGSDAPVTRNPLPVTPYPDTQSAGAGLPNIDAEAQTFIEGMTGRYIRQAGDKNLAEYDRQIADHGLTAVIAAYARAAKGLPSSPKPTARQLVWSARTILEPFVDPKSVVEIDRSEDAARRAERRDRDVWKRRVEAYRMTGQWDPAYGEPPEAA